jgi:hypothetical protein
MPIVTILTRRRYRHRIKLKDLRTQLEGQAANPVDTPPSKSLLKILRARNQKKNQKMAKEKMMRKTAEKLLETSSFAADLAQVRPLRLRATDC